MPEGLRKVIPLVLAEDLGEVSFVNPSIVMAKVLPMDLFTQKRNSGFVTLSFEIRASAGATMHIYVDKGHGLPYIDYFTFSGTEWTTITRDYPFYIVGFSYWTISRREMFGDAIRVQISGTGTVWIRNARLFLNPNVIDTYSGSFIRTINDISVAPGAPSEYPLPLWKVRMSAINVRLVYFELLPKAGIKLEEVKLDGVPIGWRTALGAGFTSFITKDLGFAITIGRNVVLTLYNDTAASITTTVFLFSM